MNSIQLIIVVLLLRLIGNQQTAQSIELSSKIEPFIEIAAADAADLRGTIERHKYETDSTN